MPILNVENDYSILITTKCNWNCPYCAVRNKVDMNANCDTENIISRLKTIPEKSNITIFGGEPGLVQEDILEEYFKNLQEKECKIYIETNGMFFKYPRLCEKTFEILYHCSQDLFEKEQIEKHDEYNVRYVIVVTDDNICRLGNFLEINRDILFDLIPSSFFHEQTGPILSEKRKHEIISKFSDRMTKESIKRMIHDKDFERVQCI